MLLCVAYLLRLQLCRSGYIVYAVLQGLTYRGFSFTLYILCDHVPIICGIISLIRDYVLLTENNVRAQLRATPQAQQFLSGYHPVRIVRLYVYIHRYIVWAPSCNLVYLLHASVQSSGPKSLY